MYVERVLSLNNGWSILTTEKTQEWKTAQAALELVDDPFILAGIERVNKEEDTEATPYFPFYIYAHYNSFLQQLGWTDELPLIKPKDRAPLKTDVMKNGVSAFIVGVTDISGGDFLDTLYLNTTYYHISKTIDVNIILVPTDDAISHIIAIGAAPSYLARLPTEDFCREQAAKFTDSNHTVPVVIAFFSPTAPTKITVEELSPLKVGGHAIERTIEFAPEYYHAGVGLLSYFGEVLRQKAPDTKAKVRIEQDGNMVRLHIESPSGDIETIEKELDLYAMVISNQTPPEELFDNPAYIMRLEHKLDVTKLELKQAYDQKQLMEGLLNRRIHDLEKDIEQLRNLVSTSLLQHTQVIALPTEQTE
jgi:hypothetical protein